MEKGEDSKYCLINNAYLTIGWKTKPLPITLLSSVCCNIS